MKKIIIANWKMNPDSQEEAMDILNSIKKEDAIICPPFVYISLLKDFVLGGQDLFWEEKGAFTGEVSASMLKNLGCKYVIVGHSERRKYFNETDESVNKKLMSAVSAGLIPIFCVGETEDERNDGKAESVVEGQVKKGLEGVSGELIIAYEPVWAIGTGNACSPDDAKKMLELIKKIKDVPVVYGGSVNGENAGSYVKEAGYDGLLVGGASLKPEEFNRIIKESE